MPDKIKVGEAALMKRINRVLAKEGYAGQKLKKARRGQDSSLGDYYIVDHEMNSLVERHVDLDACGRELGVLAGYEIFDNE